MAKSKAEQDDFIMDSELGDGDLSMRKPQSQLQRIRSAIDAGQPRLESLVQNVVSDEVNSLATTELDLLQAKTFLETHRLRRARKSVRRAEKALNVLEEDVLYLRRSIAMLHRLLRERHSLKKRSRTFFVVSAMLLALQKSVTWLRCYRSRVSRRRSHRRQFFNTQSIPVPSLLALCRHTMACWWGDGYPSCSNHQRW